MHFTYFYRRPRGFIRQFGSLPKCRCVELNLSNKRTRVLLSVVDNIETKKKAIEFWYFVIMLLKARSYT